MAGLLNDRNKVYEKAKWKPSKGHGITHSSIGVHSDNSLNIRILYNFKAHAAHKKERILSAQVPVNRSL